MISWLYEDKVNVRLIRYIEMLTILLETTPIILSDYRKGDKKQHGAGLAVDTFWPDLEPLEVLHFVKTLNIFGGIGLYLNEESVPSFHFDIRPHKDNGSIASWGCFITYVNGQKRMSYVAIDDVVKRIEKENK